MALMFQHIRFQADSTCNVMWINSCCRLQKGESIPKHRHNFITYSTSLYLSHYPFSLCNRSVPKLQLNASESHLSYPELHCRMPDLHLAPPEWQVTPQHSASLAKCNLCWKQEQFLTVYFCQLQTEQIISPSLRFAKT